MAINFSSGTNTTQISRPPRVIHTIDTVGGCPPTRGGGTQICPTTVVITNPAWIYIQGRIIRLFNGRTDLYLYGTGPNGWSSSQLRPRLNWTNGYGWDHVNMRYAAYLTNTGTYTFWLVGANNDVWGCGNDWGSLSVLVMEV
jgi:hypothetical protein